jgi:hypothetical protein
VPKVLRARRINRAALPTLEILDDLALPPPCEDAGGTDGGGGGGSGESFLRVDWVAVLEALRARQ